MPDPIFFAAGSLPPPRGVPKRKSKKQDLTPFFLGMKLYILNKLKNQENNRLNYVTYYNIAIMQ
jgi:hypothetical protein